MRVRDQGDAVESLYRSVKVRYKLSSIDPKFNLNVPPRAPIDPGGKKTRKINPDLKLHEIPMAILSRRRSLCLNLFTLTAILWLILMLVNTGNIREG